MPPSRIIETIAYGEVPAVGPVDMPSACVQIELDDFRTARLMEQTADKIELLMDDVTGVGVGQELAIADGGPARWGIVSSIQPMDDGCRVTLDWNRSGR